MQILNMLKEKLEFKCVKTYGKTSPLYVAFFDEEDSGYHLFRCLEESEKEYFASVLCYFFYSANGEKAKKIYCIFICTGHQLSQADARVGSYMKGLEMLGIL